MRLQDFAIQALEKIFSQTFGKGEAVLFGSRVDDSKKGGDIDLYLKPIDLTEHFFNQKIDFLVNLKSLIGEQKNDLIIHPYVSSTLLERIEQTGKLLCKI